MGWGGTGWRVCLQDELVGLLICSSGFGRIAGGDFMCFCFLSV